jgi:hypothetical protein
MTFAALLAQFGPTAITLIDELIATIEKKGTVTSEEWDAIQAKGNDTARDRMLKVLQTHGIDPESDQGKAFLAAASHQTQ